MPGVAVVCPVELLPPVLPEFEPSPDPVLPEAVLYPNMDLTYGIGLRSQIEKYRACRGNLVDNGNREKVALEAAERKKKRDELIDAEIIKIKL